MANELKHKTDKRISACKYFPLGTTLTKKGVNFAIYSQNATEVFLLLFDRADGEPTDIIKLENRTKYIWHPCIHGLKGEQLYGSGVEQSQLPVLGKEIEERMLQLYRVRSKVEFVPPEALGRVKKKTPMFEEIYR
jgi:isoamylase